MALVVLIGLVALIAVAVFTILHPITALRRLARLLVAIAAVLAVGGSIPLFISGQWLWGIGVLLIAAGFVFIYNRVLYSRS